jgi:dolichol-phosphate mannosyltransferase
MKLSVVLPAYNEEGSIEETLRTLYAKLQAEQIDHELTLIDQLGQFQVSPCSAPSASRASPRRCRS